MPCNTVTVVNIPPVYMHITMKNLGISSISIVFVSCFKKFKCLGDFLDNSWGDLQHLGNNFWTFLKLTLDFYESQDFSCSLKTAECGHISCLLHLPLQAFVATIMKLRAREI